LQVANRSESRKRKYAKAEFYVQSDRAIKLLLIAIAIFGSDDRFRKKGNTNNPFWRKVMSAAPMVHCFVTPQDYAEFREVCEDGNLIPEDYNVFANKVNKFIEDVSKEGVTAKKIMIKPAELAAWCKQKGRPVDARARADYALQHLFNDNTPYK
jgi:hypothetical protein